MTAWIYRNGWVTHSLIGLAITGIATAFGHAVIGATAATAYYFGREAAQCKACDQYSLEPFFPFFKWSADNHLDFWPVLIVWVIPAIVYLFETGVL